MCLTIILLVNKFQYCLVWKVKYNVCYKTLRHFTREMTLSWNLLFCMLNINDLLIKLFIFLYLVSIYVWIYLYVCTYVYHGNVCTWWFICIFMFFLLFGIENYCIDLFTPIVRFNKAYWFYLESLPKWGFRSVIIW